jgi:hypothetical protein
MRTVASPLAGHFEARIPTPGARSPERRTFRVPGGTKNELLALPAVEPRARASRRRVHARRSVARFVSQVGQKTSSELLMYRGEKANLRNLDEPRLRSVGRGRAPRRVALLETVSAVSLRLAQGNSSRSGVLRLARFVSQVRQKTRLLVGSRRLRQRSRWTARPGTGEIF